MAVESSKPAKATTPYRGLRIAMLVSFIPTFVLCIVHSALTHIPVPGTGLIPLFFSGILSLALIIRGRIENNAVSLVIFFVDIVLATSYMLVLVFTYIEVPGGNYWNNHEEMLAAYATFGLWANFFCHAHIAMLTLWKCLKNLNTPSLSALKMQRGPDTCPNCQYGLRNETAAREGVYHDHTERKNVGPIRLSETDDEEANENDGLLAAEASRAGYVRDSSS
ncbi:hypothetical protein K461DRAFT_318992 [Myriangium duriaei CBS 260.36]|uniref:Uncharacterized protein n=1 Tax=Myriangium duriaei CBS 260.36 TaxID=1168546 RepID=A0A9P4MNP9_9PEZI|nr:hypothetical protein K461DRAFT_318992 [Myriangium duriaei CBS 260.36]